MSLYVTRENIDKIRRGWKEAGNMYTSFTAPRTPRAGVKGERKD